MARQKVIADDLMPEVIDRYRAGESVRQIASRLECRPKVVHTALVRAGVEMRPVGRPRPFAGREGEMVADYEAGMSMTQLAAKYESSTATVRRALVELAVPIRRWRRLTDEQAGELVAAYLDGVPIRDLMQRFDLSRQTVHDYLRYANVPRRPTGRARTYAGREEEMAADYRAGMSQVAVGAKHGVSKDTVRRVLQEQGVKIRGGVRPPDLSTLSVGRLKRLRSDALAANIRAESLGRGPAFSEEYFAEIEEALNAAYDRDGGLLDS